MAETKAEDDDDEGFGDFTFASFPNHSVQFNSGGGNSPEDDEWGDFVEFPLHSGPSQPQSHPKHVDPSGFFSDQSQSVPKGVQLGKKDQWVKPKGALPLSLFGDAVEEDGEESRVADPSFRDATVAFAGNIRSETNVHLGVGINDIVANLYSQKLQIKAENGFNPNVNGFTLNLSNSNLNTDSNLRNENGLISNSNQLFSMPSLNFGGLNLDFNELNSSLNTIVGDEVIDGEDDGWEFKDAYTESKVGDGNGNDNGHVVSEMSEVEGKTLSKTGREMQEFPEIAMFPSGLSNGSHGSIDMFPVTNGFSRGSHKMEVLFDFKPSTMDQNGLISDSFSQPDRKDNENVLKSDPLAGSADSDGNFGEFEATFSGAGANQKVQEFPEVAMFSTGSQNGSYGPIDLFSALNEFSSKSPEVDVGVDFNQSTVDKNEFFLDLYCQTNWKDGENRLNSDSLAGTADTDENFGEFEAAFPEAGSYEKGNETSSENHKGAVPLSIFGVEEPEADESLDIQHDIMYKPPATFPRNIPNHNSTLSINDLLSDLYSQAESIPSLDSKEKTTESGLVSTDSMLSSNLLIGDDNFDDGSWEFKDALPQSRDVAQNPKQSFSSNTEPNDYVDFYRKLKDELCYVARCHLDSLKKARSIAALSGQDAKVAALDEEIQEASDELHQEHIISKEAHSYDQPPREICLKKYLEVLHELKFQALESEYHLSRRLSLAESDLRSTIELIKHSRTMLTILTLVEVKEQSDYVHLWSKIISVCAQELKHGAWIWSQASEKNVQIQILSEPQGKRYALALGEIYRAVVILGASVKFYKPWMLSTSIDSTGLYALLEECHTLWSTSGLEEALLNISDIGPEYRDIIKSLVESIKHIRDLDAVGMLNHFSVQQEYLCRLSVLTPVVVPGLKLVVWNGENYFLTLANLWANLISSDPPKLPCLHVG